MASSTTKPSASVSASRLTLSSEKPNMAMPANVPMMDSGSARAGMKVARQVRRNARMTRMTSTAVSISVSCTSCTESRIDYRAVAQHAERDGRRQQPLELRDRLVDGVGDRHRIGIGLALHGKDDRARAVELGARLVVLDEVLDAGDVLQPHRRAVAPGHDQRLEEGGGRLGALDLQDVELLLGADAADRRDGRLRRHGLPDLLHRDAARRQRIEVVLDAHRALLRTLDVDLGDAGDGRQPRAHHLVGELVHVLRRRRVGGQRQEDDGRIGRIDPAIGGRVRQVLGQPRAPPPRSPTARRARRRRCCG